MRAVSIRKEWRRLSMRNRIPVLSVVAIILLQGIVSADTIYLKNGSVLKGKVASYSEDQFVVMLNTGSERSSSKATIYSGDVSRIEFDAGMDVVVSTSSGKPQRNEIKETRDPEPVRETFPKESSTNPKESSSKSSGQSDSARDSSEAPVVDRDKDRDKDRTPTSTQASDVSEAKPPQRKGGGKPTMVDVIARRDWTSTGLILRRGDRVHISATGTVTLDQAGGLTSGPDGIDQADAKKLMQDKPTGALIAVIGADNDDFIFIGGSADFTATRNGLLFLSVNEGTLADNSGSYKAVIDVQQQSSVVR
ncbi:MAG: hypothetical protein DMF61_12685 [Blastocatellia bacterium AA13]|nr:MAG: hypothetical protein DMF61_12685 [Blastocatellia bacterium AA13]